MKTGVIDIGSNSVRLMLWADGKTLYKRLATTRLGEGIATNGTLSMEAMRRTAEAVAAHCAAAYKDGAEEVLAFATAAVRSASNGKDFVKLIKNSCGIDVDVVSGEQEAQLGLFGAIGSTDGGIIDVGGASSEVTVRIGGQIVYSYSGDIGTVRIFDAAGRDYAKIKDFISSKIVGYSPRDFSFVKMYAIGGTASRLGAMSRGVKVYDSAKIHGAQLAAAEIHAGAERLCSLSVEEIRKKTICGASSDVIGGGAELLASIMDRFSIKQITVSESDNLEGYMLLKRGN